MNIIKESIDNLPMGVCFFGPYGMVKLINKKMLKLSFYLCQRDMQTLSEFQYALKNPPQSVEIIDRKANIFGFADGTAFQFEEKEVFASKGETFIQITAADVTELIARRNELKRENNLLEIANKRAKQLYDNMAEIVREEEILQIKMRVHDDIGYSILSARNILMKNDSLESIISNAKIWENSIELLYHSNKTEIPDDLELVKKRAEEIGVKLNLEGDIPKNNVTKNIYTLAIKECVTNCVRHAQGNAVIVSGKRKGEKFIFTVKNNGNPPVKEISEGGGLSALRSRIERSGGKMIIESLPSFILTVELSLKEEHQC